MALFTKLQPKAKHRDSDTILLLDTSGSMNEYIRGEEGLEQRKIDLLFQAVKDTPECQGLRAYSFNSTAHHLEFIPESGFQGFGGTAMHSAFDLAKKDGHFNAILVTDGEPDSERLALDAAIGMRLGIIYIGNPPVPHFLEELAKATDGTFQIADMRTVGQLEDAIRHALPPPDPKDDSKGPIQL
jgi:hypothetical protein